MMFDLVTTRTKRITGK